ncbi:GtrA family protein [Pseudomonas fluorescens]|jgi:putative flippase GtrA|nr:GtrA family protein [Pseudomonas fluorescens]
MKTIMTLPLQLLKDKSFWRFLVVGLLNTSLSLITIYTAKYFLNFGDVSANVLGYLIGLITSYSLNSRWTFEFGGKHNEAIKRFLISFLLSYIANIAVVLTCIHILQWNSYIAQALGMPTYTITNFLLSKHYTFKLSDTTHE